MTPTDPAITKRIAAAIHRYGMIEPGDKVLLAVSGGKDSMTLLAHLWAMAPHFPIPFEVVPAHIRTDFANPADEERVAATLEAWGVPVHVEDVRIKERVKPGRTMNCYWCSTQRRTELLRLAEARGCQRIALGHHLDDIIETLVMNMAYKGEMSTMLPTLRYDRYPQTIIRPLALVPQEDIVRFAGSHGLLGVVCQCGYAENSKRRDVRRVIEELSKSGDRVRENLFAAMSNVKPEYLPPPPAGRGKGHGASAAEPAAEE